MHGRIKVKAPKEIQAERTRQERIMAKKIREDLDQVWDKRKNECYDEEALMMTGKILLQNADHQTVWNFRREIILHWRDHGLIKTLPETTADQLPNKPPDSLPADGCLNITGDQVNDISTEDGTSDPQEPIKPEEVQSNVQVVDMEKIYLDELKFTSSCLIKHPKSYGTWHHRSYIIQLMKDPPFKDEVKACDHFLDLDERNFHCWDYRRFICTFGKIDPQNELQFTQRKISQNFSNFSSFYYRSSLLTIAHREGALSINDYWDSDYETISNAIFVDPNDQSPWFYHKWLLAADQFITNQLTQPESQLYKVILDKTANRLVYQFHRSLPRPPFNTVQLVTSDGKVTTLEPVHWETIEPFSSIIWYHSLNEPASSISQLIFQMDGNDHKIDLKDLNAESNLSMKTISTLPKASKINPESKLDGNKLNNLKLLLEIEPENKWINLTMAWITDALDETAYDKLIQIDPLRRNYYNDQKSKQTLENQMEDVPTSAEKSLTNLKLTCLYFTNQLTHLRGLDLSNNCFVKLSKSFNYLISLETLILDNNRLSMVDRDFKLLSLKQLSLKHNCFRSYSHFAAVSNCPSLETLDISGNKLDVKQENSIFPDHVKIIRDD